MFNIKFNFHLSELAKRTIVACFGIAALLIIYQLDMVHHLLSILFFVLYSELLITCYDSKITMLKKSIVFAAGVIYMALGLQSLADALSFGFLLHILAAVFATDTAAFAFGRVFKGPKLVPKISPNKTWSGAIAGLIVGACMFEYFLAQFIFPDRSWVRDFFYGASFAIVIQLGDLLVSFAKRVCKIKDASKLLPGHGGFWDRCDSLFAGAIFVSILRIIKLGVEMM